MVKFLILAVPSLFVQHDSNEQKITNWEVRFTKKEKNDGDAFRIDVPYVRDNFFPVNVPEPAVDHCNLLEIDKTSPHRLLIQESNRNSSSKNCYVISRNKKILICQSKCFCLV